MAAGPQPLAPAALLHHTSLPVIPIGSSPLVAGMLHIWTRLPMSQLSQPHPEGQGGYHINFCSEQ